MKTKSKIIILITALLFGSVGFLSIQPREEKRSSAAARS